MTLERTPSSTEESVRTPPAAERQQVDHDGSPTPVEGGRRTLQKLSVVVLVIGLVVTGALTASSRLSYLHNEQRLTDLQTSLTASALGVAPADLERLLGQAVSAAGEAPDPVATFRRLDRAVSHSKRDRLRMHSLVVVGNGKVRVFGSLWS